MLTRMKNKSLLWAIWLLAIALFIAAPWASPLAIAAKLGLNALTLTLATGLTAMFTLDS